MEVEYNLGLLAGSLSSLRKLFKIKSIFSSSSNYLRQQGSTGQYELSQSNNKNYDSNGGNMWRSKGILKTSEIITSVQEDRNDSQERIVPNYGQGHSTGATISS